jgi:hypothetical protein
LIVHTYCWFVCYFGWTVCELNGNYSNGQPGFAILLEHLMPWRFWLKTEEIRWMIRRRCVSFTHSA